MKIDSHIHGEYSSDSVIKYRELCELAINKDYSHIVFTEHYDLIDTELTHYGLLPIKRYFDKLKDLRVEFPNLHIITGIELGEPHRVMDFAKRLLSNFTPDYLIGSLHVTRSNINVSLKIDFPLAETDVKAYYEENLEIVENGGFDTLGHLGIFKRGLESGKQPEESKFHYIIDEIFKTMIRNNICLEVNYSGFKSSFNNHIPEPKILSRYLKLGGELITISSDSHDLKHFDKYYDKTLDNLKEIGYKCLYYKFNGKWNKLKI